MKNITYSEIESNMNPKYRNAIANRRFECSGTPISQPLTGGEIFVYGCAFMLNKDFFLEG